MRTNSIILTGSLLVAGMLASQEGDAQMVFIPDPNLRSALTEVMVGDSLNTEDPAILDIRDLQLGQVSDLTGIEHLVALDSLVMDGNIMNLTWPSVMPPVIRTWSLDGYGITFPETQVEIPSLRVLRFTNCGLSGQLDVPDGVGTFEALWTGVFDEWPVFPEGLDSAVIIANSGSGIWQTEQFVEWPTSLRSLDLSCQYSGIGSISHLPTTLPPNLERLVLDGIGTNEVPSLPWTLRSLRIAYNLAAHPCLPPIPPNVTDLTFSNHAGPQYGILCVPNLPLGVDPALHSIPICTIWNSTCLGGNEIQGTVFSDADNDGALDEGESGIQNAMVIAQPGNVITSSSNSGAYRTWVSAGDFTVEPIPQLYQSFTGSPRSVSFADVGLIDTGNDLGLFLEPNVQDLRVTGFSTPTRPGFQNLLWLSQRNVGTISTNATLRLTFDAQQAFVAAEPPPTSVSGNVIEWDLATEVGEFPRTFSIHLFTPADVPLGTELSYTVEADPVATDETPEDNSITIIEPVIGSFDPNDKHVEPGSLTPAEVLERKKLDYTIRFQNTGTYLAENALITDFLSEDLDPMTFEFVGSSHPCEWYISNGQLQFQFEGIMLPDSISNEPESHGFVRFRIAARPDLQLGETVSNSASIHFDFNTPVVTDPAVFSVEEVTAVQEPRTDRLALYPNPVEQTLWISGTHQGNVRAVEVMDLSGRVVLRSTAYAAGAAIDVSTLPSGMYHVRATAVEGLLSGRFVKR